MSATKIKLLILYINFNTCTTTANVNVMCLEFWLYEYVPQLDSNLY